VVARMYFCTSIPQKRHLQVSASIDIICPMELNNEWQLFSQSLRVELALDASEEMLRQFQALYDVLLETNKSINLTRITDLSDFCRQHLLDSLTLSRFFLKSDFSLIDIGSGAGFPALPLAIVYPQARIVAVESVQKKAKFIAEAARDLNLQNLSVQAERSEVLAHKDAYREQFDFVTARAVSALNVLCELCLPFVKLHGHFLAMKTTSAAELEVQQAKTAISELGGKLCEIVDVSTQTLPNRSIVVIEKVASTPSKYPRKPGSPEKKRYKGNF
jgi:16S rRNA (guanine527-N7)-methyltransferase